MAATNHDHANQSFPMIRGPCLVLDFAEFDSVLEAIEFSCSIICVRDLGMHNRLSITNITDNHELQCSVFSPCLRGEDFSRLILTTETRRTLRTTWFSIVLLISCLTLVAMPASAQRQARQTATTPAIPSPRSVLGFNPGDDRTIADWKQISDYFSRLDKASDRVQVQTIGNSTLGRTMIAAFISAPENIRNLEKYKTIQTRLADPRKAPTDTDRDQLIHDGKTVVVISCSIHSTEIVAS